MQKAPASPAIQELEDQWIGFHGKIETDFTIGIFPTNIWRYYIYICYIYIYTMCVPKSRPICNSCLLFRSQPTSLSIIPENFQLRVVSVSHPNKSTNYFITKTNANSRATFTSSYPLCHLYPHVSVKSTFPDGKQL